MKDNVSYDRPVSAKLVVELENGERFDATAEDIAKFGYVDPHTVERRFAAWLQLAHPEVDDLTKSPLNPFRYAAECAAHYPHMPDEDVIAEVRSMLGASLTLHLISKHAVAGIVEDPFDLHQHEHDGPGTIRNHDRGDADYDLEKVAKALAEDS